MFSWPDAKRVRRDALDSEEAGSSDGEVDAALEARLNEHMARSLGLATGATTTTTTTTTKTTLQSKVGGSEDHGEYEFRLFSTAPAASKVVLDDGSEAQGEGALLRQRPSSFYLQSEISTTLREQYAAAAVSGEDVLARSRWRTWGTELPWKVIRTDPVRRSRPRDDGTTAVSRERGSERAPGRKRPGKKTRIAQRKRERAAGAERERAAQQLAEKEEHLRDKRKRMNRLKKLRRRAKGKEGQAGALDAG